MSKRQNGEGSFYSRKDSDGHHIGYAAYVWITKPDGKLDRKYIYGIDHDKLHKRWTKLKAKALEGPVSADQKVKDFANYWLEEVIKPNSSPRTYDTYKGWVKLQIIPGIGNRSIDGKLTVRVVQEWFNKVAGACQCCFQSKDTKRSPEKRRCCAKGKCCQQRYDPESLWGLLRTIRSMLSQAQIEEISARNVAAFVKIPRVRKKRKKAAKKRWSVDEARKFLESAKSDRDPFYAAYAFIIVMGFRVGEAMGVDRSEVDLDAGELDLGYQVQRVSAGLIRRETKTDESDETVPLISLVTAAIRLTLEVREEQRQQADDAWQDSTLVTTTPLGTLQEPSNFTKAFRRRCLKAGVTELTPRDARRTCSSLLVDLDVNPRVIMKILRHAKISTTMDIYARPSSEATRAALQRLGDELES